MWFCIHVPWLLNHSLDYSCGHLSSRRRHTSSLTSIMALKRAPDQSVGLWFMSLNMHVHVIYYSLWLLHKDCALTFYSIEVYIYSIWPSSMILYVFNFQCMWKQNSLTLIITRASSPSFFWERSFAGSENTMTCIPNNSPENDSTEPN